MNKFTVLYDLFRKYKKPKAFPICECCVDANEMKLLLSKKLEELSEKELSEYASSVFLTVGSREDFLYFFPRIFQLSMNDKFDWPDPEIVFRSIKSAGWDRWSFDEKSEVLKIVGLKFETLLKNGGGPSIDEILCATSYIEADLKGYLSKLENAAENTLMAFLEWNMSAYANGKLCDEFWSDNPDQEKQVLSWMRSDKISALLFAKYGMKI